jgi:thiol-disulfide isomerase/thioredoxin
MKKVDITWRLFSMYLLIILFMLIAGTANSQITVKHFNAKWNETNGVDWIMELEDCKTKSYIDIGKEPELQKKYKIAVVPTIIIFKDGEEVARFQADLSFKMVSTREEVQEEIHEQLMSDF